MNIQYKDTNYFSTLVLDYLNQDENVQSLSNFPFDKDSFKEMVDYRKETFSLNQRILLSDVLNKQYAGLDLSPEVEANLALIKSEQSFTITTGHQLNIFTGPLYFFYKIMSVINACESLKNTYGSYNFIPVFWMAAEDHDFEEISSISLFQEKLEWEKDQTGAVGRMNPYGLKKAISQLEEILKGESNGTYLLELFKKAYLEHKTLAQAHRSIVHTLFKSYGLLIIDGDDQQLKATASSIFEKEIKYHLIHKKVEETNQSIKTKGYKVQVNPRPLNLFYLKGSKRNLLFPEGSNYVLKDGAGKFTPEELIGKAQNDPMSLSPNVLCRPLYQEFILPNLSYCGGGGELAYWLQLKETFDAFEMKLPVLMLRNSCLLIDQKTKEKLSQFKIDVADYFKGLDYWMNTFVKNEHTEAIDIQNEKKQIEAAMQAIKAKASLINPSLEQSFQADLQKLNKVIQGVEQKMIKASKKGAEQEMKQIQQLHHRIFPNGSLQERTQNFIPFYLKHGDLFIKKLKEHIDPFEHAFNIIEL